jgi:hypothetical protein
VFFGQSFVLALICALANRSRSALWLLSIPFAVLFAIGFLADEVSGSLLRLFAYRWSTGGRTVLVILVYGLPLPLILTYFTMLVLSVALWPLKVFLGWHVAWDDDRPTVVRHASVLSLMMWVGLWAALLFLITRSVERFGASGVMAVLIGGSAVLLAGIPLACLFNRRGRWFVTFGATILFIAGLSYAESELTFWFDKLTANSGAWIPLGPVLCFNAALGSTVGLNCLVICWMGARMHMPLWRPKPQSVAANSANRSRIAQHEPG